MKECEKVGDLFGDLQDSLLDGNLEKRVREHIHECTWCREDFKWYGITVQTLANLERMNPPDDFLVQLNARLSTQSPSWSSSFSSSFFDFFRNFFTTAPYMPLPAGVGALALIVAVGFLVYNQAPTDIAPYGVADMAVRNVGARSTAPARMTAGGTGQVQGEQMHVGGMVARATQPDPQNPTLFPSQLSATPKSLEGDSRSLPLAIPAGIGANNLIVESPRIDQALASLKQMLPHIEGRLVDERNGGGKVVVGVMIPPNAYGRLTTELINHGAVAVGTSVEGAPSASVPAPAPAKADGKNVLLYIRFMSSP